MSVEVRIWAVLIGRCLCQVAVANVPGANDQPVRQQRQLVDKEIKNYSELTRKVEVDLR